MTANAVPIRVRVVDDINLCIVAASDARWVGAHVLHASSVRRDVEYPFALGSTDRMQRAPFSARDVDRLFPASAEATERKRQGNRTTISPKAQMSLKAAGQADKVRWSARKAKVVESVGEE